MVEIWKDVEGYEGLYQVSNLGRIRSKDRYINNNGGTEYRKGHILNGCMCKGYRTVLFSKEGVTKRFRVARLVAQAFIPNPDNKPHVNHINTIRTDDRVWVNEDGSIDYDKSNLEWCTRIENMNNPLTKEHLSIAKGNKIMAVFADGVKIFTSILQASKELNLTRQTIYRSLEGKTIYNNQVKFELCG